MALKPRVIYDAHSDQIHGFQNYGQDLVEAAGESAKDGTKYGDVQKTGKNTKLEQKEGLKKNIGIANKALVFYLRGLRMNWHLLFVYYFNQGGIKTNELRLLLPFIIRKAHSVGLRVRATVSDQASVNCRASKDLINEIERVDGYEAPYFKVDQEKIYQLLDSPHMWKCLKGMAFGNYAEWRNANQIANIFDYPGNTIVFDGLTASYHDLMLLFELHYRTGNTRLHESIVFPQSKDKMSVKYFAVLFSGHTATELRSAAYQRLVEDKIPGGMDPSICTSTSMAQIVEEWDKFFDLMNGPTAADLGKKPTKIHLTADSIHVPQWKILGEKLKNTKFITPVGKENTRNVIENMRRTLLAMENLWNNLQREGFKMLNLRHLNQDPLENFNGVMRQGCGDNTNPTTIEYVRSWKSAMLTKYSSGAIKGANCEHQDINFLIDQFDLLKNVERLAKEKKTVNERSHDHTTIEFAPDSPPVLHLDEYDSGSEEISELINGKSGEMPELLARDILKNISFDKCVPCKLCFTNSVGEDFEDYFDSSEASKCTVQKALMIFDEEMRPTLHINFKDVTKRMIVLFHLSILFDWLTCMKHKEEMQERLLRILSRTIVERECGIRNRDLKAEDARAKNAQKIAQQAQRNPKGLDYYQ